MSTATSASICGAAGGRWGKRWQGSRAANAPALFDWPERAGVAAPIGDGFGPRPAGEDPFDATVGLLGMLEVVLGRRPDGAPPEPEVRRIEGWIFGADAGA